MKFLGIIYLTFVVGAADEVGTIEFTREHSNLDTCQGYLAFREAEANKMEMLGRIRNLKIHRKECLKRD